MVLKRSSLRAINNNNLFSRSFKLFWNNFKFQFIQVTQIWEEVFKKRTKEKQQFYFFHNSMNMWTFSDLQRLLNVQLPCSLYSRAIFKTNHI